MIWGLHYYYYYYYYDTMGRGVEGILPWGGTLTLLILFTYRWLVSCFTAALYHQIYRIMSYFYHTSLLKPRKLYQHTAISSDNRASEQK